MHRGPLYQDSYRPHFSGHETFPLRYGWLKNAFDAVLPSDNAADNRRLFTAEDAIARFGVGRNMVSSMKHWALTSGVLQLGSKRNSIRTTHFGRLFFGPDGLDPYMEHPTTSWLVHWNICGRPNKTTWYWAFSHYPSPNFTRRSLALSIEELVRDRGWRRVSPTTIKRDVSCLLRTYVAHNQPKNLSYEDVLDSVLTEIGLIKSLGNSGTYVLSRDSQRSLRQGAFCYAVSDFWVNYTHAQTLSFESIAYEPGSPGKVFCLDEDALLEHLSQIDEFTNGIFHWSETAGLKQLVRSHAIDMSEILDFVKADYSENHDRGITDDV